MLFHAFYFLVSQTALNRIWDSCYVVIFLNVDQIKKYNQISIPKIKTHESQNFKKVNELQQTPKIELSEAGKSELAKALTDIQLQNDCFESTQPRIMLDSSEFQDNHSSTENLLLDSVSKALREESIKSTSDEEAVSTQSADPFIEQSSKLLKTVQKVLKASQYRIPKSETSERINSSS